MATRPEGFWWFQKGEYDERKVDQDVRERLPRWYADNGFVDFQVTHDSLVADSAGGKAVLHLTVDEGQPYQVGAFDIEGNRRFSTEELQAFYPFGPVGPNGTPERAAPVQPLGLGRGHREGPEPLRQQRLHLRPGRARPRPGAPARTASRSSTSSWTIREGSPATINKVEIVGNDVTHERVIREAIVMLPGDLFSRERLIRSYQNVSNLGFFQQPLPSPDVKPAANGVDVDIIFRVEERRTGNINFGASLGQGTGVGGFLGLEEPNLFGRGKRGRLQWQFGKNINDFTLSYTDPGHPREPDLRHGLAVRFARALHHRRPRPAEADRRQRSSSASRSWARAIPGSSPPTPISGSATARARRTCGPGSAAAPAAARRSAPASSATPGSGCRSRPAARSPT